MIYDRIDRMGLYAHGDTPLAAAMRALLCGPAGTPVQADGVKSSLVRFTTSPLDGARFEAHRRHVDIHVGLRGREYVEWAQADELTDSTRYDAERDTYFGDCVRPFKNSLWLTPGFFVVFFPHDAHLVGRHTDEPSDVEKLVAKAVLPEAPAK
ncbi:YhcH/YjgK/YiaL family protein [Cohnella sp. JJ-181]|uniref:YhcH/YjgK/YiaL family protein n=1 Tax=Cohnella rhizoplanae TaxID=2974897 RepID=UPI0022FF72B9|nr:YhcH/YjgK/YiaL family protein [Cohnella sp. JJ-181]CAI6066447.1 hypothetical protein COHCIP112018_02101 [Cohnella sp. JJ-181]